MQRFVTTHLCDVIAIQQPVDLLAGHRHGSFIVLGPFKFLFGQGFVIQYKAIAFPEQAFDFIALAINKDVKFTIKGIVAQFQFNNGAEAAIALAKIHRLAVKY